MVNVPNRWCWYYQVQAHHFKSYAPKKIGYRINRYTNETKRLFSILKSHLKSSKYLVGEQLTVSDIETIPWVSGLYLLDIDLNEFPNVNDLVNRVEEIHEVTKGYDAPTKNLNKEYKKNPELLKEKMEENAKWVHSVNKI